jgi:predicted NAD/FAD-binding protein
MGQRIAIVGTGISGLGAAWALHEDHDIVVFEAAERLGGHSNTVDVMTSSGITSVDTGFIVYNEVTYPHLTRLFADLRIPTEPSEMSFSYSLDRRREYAANLKGVLARPSNLARPRFLRMLRDIERFRRIGNQLQPEENETIGELMARTGFSEGFLDEYLYPMTGAIWSAGMSEISRHPAPMILEFLANHGLIDIVGRPKWRTVSGGSRTYVQRLTAGFSDRIRLRSPVLAVERHSNRVTVHTPTGASNFDQVIIATHSDQALQALGSEATNRERSLLGAIPYQENVAVLHSDPTLMPSRRALWSSWNAMTSTELPTGPVASVTYWMNRLQNLDSEIPLFVSLNPLYEPRPETVHEMFTYTHPQFDPAAVQAQLGIAEIQGQNRTWYAGAYLGYGFHEDGLQAGLNVAAALGSPAPWQGTFRVMSSTPPALRTDAAIR